MSELKPDFLLARVVGFEPKIRANNTVLIALGGRFSESAKHTLPALDACCDHNLVSGPWALKSLQVCSVQDCAQGRAWHVHAKLQQD